jgi:hypothetical protein
MMGWSLLDATTGRIRQLASLASGIEASSSVTDAKLDGSF